MLDTFQLKMESLRSKDDKVGRGAITKIELMGVTERGEDKGEKMSDADMTVVCALLSVGGVLPQLDILRLDDNRIGAIGFERFAAALAPGVSAALTNVRHIQLQRNNLGDLGMKLLLPRLREGALPRLCELHLAYNGLSDDSAVLFGEALAAGALPKLTHLNLSQNRLADASCVEIGRALREPSRKAFAALYLGGNAIGDAGGADIAQLVAGGSPAGGFVPKLGVLQLFGNQLSAPTKAAVSEAAKGRPLLQMEGALDLD